MGCSHRNVPYWNWYDAGFIQAATDRHDARLVLFLFSAVSVSLFPPPPTDCQKKKPKKTKQQQTVEAIPKGPIHIQKSIHQQSLGHDLSLPLRLTI